jgi:hypothetical protein
MWSGPKAAKEAKPAKDAKQAKKPQQKLPTSTDELRKLLRDMMMKHDLMKKGKN